MKILILANLDLGLYRFRKELISALLKEHQVYISLPYGEMVEPLKEMGCIFRETPVDRRGVNPLTDLGLFLAYGKLVREIRPDLVITYTIKPNIYGSLACRLHRVPYAVNVTGLGTAFEKEGLLQTLVTHMYRPALKKARVVFTENQSIKKQLAQKRIVSADRIQVLSGAGINLEDFGYLPYPRNPVFTFLFIGRIMQEKGIGELLEAVQELNQEGRTCRLDLVGFCEEDYREKLERGEKEGWIRNFGFQKDVRPFIEGADCFVLPSWHEGMANTNLECAASGRPVVTSDIPGCREAVRDKVTGFLCRSRNAGSLKEAMGRVMDLSVQEREAMGRAGRRYMEEKFDKKDVVRETLRFLF